MKPHSLDLKYGVYPTKVHWRVYTPSGSVLGSCTTHVHRGSSRISYHFNQRVCIFILIGKDEHLNSAACVNVALGWQWAACLLRMCAHVNLHWLCQTHQLPQRGSPQLLISEIYGPLDRSQFAIFVSSTQVTRTRSKNTHTNTSFGCQERFLVEQHWRV